MKNAYRSLFLALILGFSAPVFADSSAGSIKVDNSRLKLGRGKTITVQQALDRLGSPLKALLQRKASQSGVSSLAGDVTFKGKVYKVCASGVESKDVTFVMSPSSDSAGTFTISGPLFVSGPSVCAEDAPESTSFSGSYEIRGTSLFVINVTGRGGAVNGVVVFEVRNNTLRFPINLSGDSVTELERQ